MVFKQGLREGEEEEGEKEEERGEIKPRYGCMTLVWILVWNCMIFFVHKLLGYVLLGFSLEINWVPFSRVLLEIHPNSRFKGSLVENH